ncbi:MAG: pyrH [Gammaproteobacteria bacterium]|jgi:uridylate kinase|nr:pyrH [Gammaproteobacteria bacterium]
MAYKRVLLKLSGEAFAGESQQGVSPERLLAVAKDIQEAVTKGVQVAIVVGGGNFLRGASVSNEVISRTTADHMGMLGTILNGLALRDALESINLKTALFSALAVQGVAEGFDYRKAIYSLQQGHIVIFAGGTGNPFVTTDSTASLRAIEINADIILKATKVDGVYTSDPKKDASAKRYDKLTFDEALQKQLAVMDLAAFCQCRDYNIAIQVFNLFKPGALARALSGANEGTLVTRE